MDSLSTAILILAAGQANRWEGDTPKQLMMLGDETVIGRTVRMVYEQVGFYPTIATHRSGMDLIAPCYMPVARTTVCDTVLSTASLWQDETIILLGDVVYSPELMQAILFNELYQDPDQYPLLVYGNRGEIFAIRFIRRAWASVKDALTSASGYRRGKLRQFYRAYCGLPLGLSETSYPADEGVYIPINDWSLDIDRLDQYNSAVETLKKRGLLQTGGDND